MKKANLFLTISILLFFSTSQILSFRIPEAKAATGKANVYIVNLPDVGGWWSRPQRVKKGAIAALTALSQYDNTSQHADTSNLPLIHPKLGNTPPFIDISYKVVSDWAVYKQIIESYEDVIIVNTHDQILPVPSGYSKEAWADKIAESMLKRRVTWVHVIGYPFYQVWYQGATSWEMWGETGFHRVMQHINKGYVTIPYLDGSQISGITSKAEKILATHLEELILVGR